MLFHAPHPRRQVLKGGRNGEIAPVDCQRHIHGLMSEIAWRCYHTVEQSFFLQLLGALSLAPFGAASLVRYGWSVMKSPLRIGDKERVSKLRLNFGVKKCTTSRQFSCCNVASLTLAGCTNGQQWLLSDSRSGVAANKSSHLSFLISLPTR